MPDYPTTTLKTSCAFTDANDTAVDPTTVRCTVTDPSGNSATYIYGTDANCTKASTGNYDCTFDADEAGEWKAVWYGADTTAKVTTVRKHEVKST